MKMILPGGHWTFYKVNGEYNELCNGATTSETQTLNKEIMGLNSIILFGILTVFTSCNGQNTSQVDKTPTPKDPFTLKGDTVSEISKDAWYIFQDRKNNFWFGTNGHGVYRYDAKNLMHFTSKHGLCNDQIRGIQEDRSGNLFFNTTNGISKFDGKTFTTMNAAKGDLSNSGWGLQPDDLWFQGTQDSGVVYRYYGGSLYRLEFPETKAGKEFISKFPRSKFPHMIFSPYDVYIIYKDSKGNVWFGTAELGICRYDGRSFSWMYEEHLTNIPGGGDFGIRSIIEDKEGKFWFCNTRYRYNINPAESEKGFINYKREQGIDNLKAPNGDDMIYYMSITEDNKRNLWMATYNLGVWQYDGKNVTRYPVKDGSKDITVFSIYKDRQGGLWLGTHEAGPYKFNGKTFEKFRP